jgi:hypothetical protein
MVSKHGHVNALTVVLNTEGNILGGFTPVECESRLWNGKGGDEDSCWKVDDSQKSFLFTLKNPHNIAARRFALKAQMKDQAILRDSKFDPCIGAGADISVSDSCNPNTLTPLTPATPDWTSASFSRVRCISKSKKLKSSKSQPKQLFMQVLLASASNMRKTG